MSLMLVFADESTSGDNLKSSPKPPSRRDWKWRSRASAERGPPSPRVAGVLLGTRGLGGPRSSACGAAALGGIADWQSAGHLLYQGPADCQSATQQVANRRYGRALTATSSHRRRSGVASRHNHSRPPRPPSSSTLTARVPLFATCGRKCSETAPTAGPRKFPSPMAAS